MMRLMSVYCTRHVRMELHVLMVMEKPSTYIPMEKNHSHIITSYYMPIVKGVHCLGWYAESNGYLYALRWTLCMGRWPKGVDYHTIPGLLWPLTADKTLAKSFFLSFKEESVPG